MIVVMKKGSSSEAVEAIASRIAEMGMRAHIIVGTDRTVVAAVGKEEEGNRQILAGIADVEQVMSVLAPYKIASRETKNEPTVIQTGSLTLGGGRLGVIAGPCSVEGPDEIIEAARLVKAAGATALRGGAYKPRTSPYSFQGYKVEGLKMLAAAREATGLAVVTEVMAPQEVPIVTEYADVLQIGARNMQNYPLLEAAGEIRKPVLLKRGPAATVEEFLLAAEYILDRGNSQVILCERGIRTFEAHTRFTLPLAVVPYLKERTHLPVVIDPSHGTGIASLVPAMALAAIAAGADGLIIEVHQNPAKAMSDGAQSLTPDAFTELMVRCQRVAAAVDMTL